MFNKIPNAPVTETTVRQNFSIFVYFKFASRGTPCISVSCKTRRGRSIFSLAISEERCTFLLRCSTILGQWLFQQLPRFSAPRHSTNDNFLNRTNCRSSRDVRAAWSPSRSQTNYTMTLFFVLSRVTIKQLYLRPGYLPYLPLSRFLFIVPGLSNCRIQLIHPFVSFFLFSSIRISIAFNFFLFLFLQFLMTKSRGSISRKSCCRMKAEASFRSHMTKN